MSIEMTEEHSEKLAIETSGLRKVYPNGTVAVDYLDLQIRQGEVYGLLGPNGSGKTTTILMLLGLTEPTAGTISVVGRDPLRDPLSVKQKVAYMPDSVGFYSELTAVENLIYTMQLAGIQDAEKHIREALERLGLKAVSDDKVGTFSRGMRQRLGLAEIVAKQPEIAILDEPTQGLDPELAHEFLGLVKSLKQDGMTVLLSSHLLDQVQKICDRVGLFYRGRLVMEGTVEDLTRNYSDESLTATVEAKPADRDRFLEQLRGLAEVKSVQGEQISLDSVYREFLAKERKYETA
jgi:ABC-2 type transport system ATP-binding protein